MEFPDQTISKREREEKDKKWYKDHFTYFDNILVSQKENRERLDVLYADYHGKFAEKRRAEWTERYKVGSDNISKTKYILHKLAASKLDRLVGEFEKRSFKPTVMTTNKDAVTAKMKVMAQNLGLMYAADEVNKLRENGFEIYGGMPVLNIKDPAFKDKVNPKTQVEKFMTIAMHEQIKRLRIKDLLGVQTLKDVLIGAECHAYTYITPSKKVAVERIHPSNAGYEEFEGDEFIEKSGIVGFRRETNIPDALQQNGHKLTKKQKKQLRDIPDNTGNWTSNGLRNVEKKKGKVYVWETKIFWFSVKTIKQKITPSKNNEWLDYYDKILSDEYYEENKEKIEREASEGKYQIRDNYAVTIYEASRYGSDIYYDMREQEFIIKSLDDAMSVYYNYTGLLFNTTDYRRLSLYEKMKDLDELYDGVMFQLRRELGKFKGSVITFDEAFLTKGKTLNDVMYNMTEDQILTYNSNAEENQGAIRKEQAGVNSFTIGEVQNIRELLTLKLDIQATMDRISGINEFREGDAPASSTATQNLQGLEASRTVTAPIFFAHNKFLENLLMRIAELTKYSIGVLGDDSFDSIIGDDGITIMKKTSDIPFYNYGVYFLDPNKEAEIRQKVSMYGNLAINRGEIKISDMIESEMAETLTETVSTLKEGLRQMDEFKQREQEAMLKSQQENVQTQVQGQKELMEDQQEHEKEKIVLKGQVDAQVKTQDAKQKSLLQEQEKE